MSLLRNIFTKSLSDSAKAYQALDQGSNHILWSPESDRYTYDNRFDSNYDKDWSPTTSQEKKTLTPEGYHRVGDRSEVKADLKGSMSDKDFDENYVEKQVSIGSTAFAKNGIDIQEDPKHPGTYGVSVTFKDGKKSYFYPGVPLELIEAWMKAPSKGEFFMKYIHPVYSLNKSHKPAGESPTYGDLTSKQVAKFMKKYKKDYFKGGMVNV